MANHMVVPKFRDMFTLAKNIDYKAWFPGHMRSGMLAMQRNLKNVDCVIEIHDARIPISGRNPLFHKTFGSVRPHALVLNKIDMADLSRKEEIESLLKKEGIKHIIYANCLSEFNSGLSNLVPTIVKLIKNSNRYNRMDDPQFTVMIMGIPNVGKSSVINMLRSRYLKKRKGAPVGGVPGITRHVMERIKIHHDPPIYVLDTPGVLMPKVANIESALRLALCHTVKSVVETDLVADYLLYWLNKHKNFEYVEYLQLEKPTDDIRELLLKTAIKLHAVRKIKNMEGTWETVYDFKKASTHFIDGFREGAYGRVMLDDDYLPKIKVV